ncbi:hypothetical protein [Pseudomonas yamanorum]|uniref:hypothetical protein n=1 Tax=Pseudomonas yamanorum TaxID=515393 RepID=UPI00210A1053|nr:hypothetical protein [Pseudomonas yamanorum]
MKKIMYRGLRQALTGVALSLASVFAQAAVQEITAEFRPDPTNPTLNKFTNTTPQSGICPGHIPARCEQLGILSIRTWDINFTANAPILVGAETRQGVMFKVPSDWRSFEVVSDKGERETVQMRIAGIGNRYDTIVGGTRSWGPYTFGNPPAPCGRTGMFTGSSSYALWFWLVPEGAGVCSLDAIVDVPRLYYANFEYAYELRTPNPLSMAAGQYRGAVSFSLGPNQDFDFGDLMIPNDETLTFNFTLDVDHIFKVEIPPGGDRIELIPQGGWQSWVQQGRRPTRLFRDQTFNIWSSGRFKMQLECQFPMGNTCGLQAASGEMVPLNIAVSLPGGIGDETGQRVNRQPLLLDGSTTRLFKPIHYVERRPGTLHFDIPASDVAPLFVPGAPDRYAGTATLIWDSEV